MIAQERLPALRRWTSPARQVLGNAGLPDIDADRDRESGFPQTVMSALPPDSDIRWRIGEARGSFRPLCVDNHASVLGLGRQQFVCQAIWPV